MLHFWSQLNLNPLCRYWLSHEQDLQNLSLLQYCVMNQTKYEDVSTCTRKPQCNQIISYLFVTLLLLAEFVALIPHLQNPAAKYVLGSIFLLLFLCLAISTVQTSRIDPVDPVLVTFLNGERSQILKIINSCLYCDTCRSYVKSTSKHCKICNRCVDHFDHHCIWINNCIGRQNYRWFIAMILSASMYLLIFIVSVSFIWAESSWNDYLGYMILLWLCLAIAIPFFILLTLLLIFHFYLIHRGLTTFEFLTAPQKKAKGQGDNQLEGQNKTEIQLDNNKVKNTYYQADQIIFRELNNTPQKVSKDNMQSKYPSQSSFSDKQENQSTSSKHKSKQQTQNNKQHPEQPEQVEENQKEERFFFKNRARSLKVFGQSIEVKSNQSQPNDEVIQSVQAVKNKAAGRKREYQNKRASLN